MTQILVAEDDPGARLVAETCLTEAGYQVLTASDGKMALQLIREQRPRIVLLDIMMPRMHGFAALQEIRADPDLRDIYVIMVSAKSYPADIQKAMDLGANDYLIKPYKANELRKKIQTALQTRQDPSQNSSG